MIMDAVWRADDVKMCDKKCRKFHSQLKDVIIHRLSSTHKDDVHLVKSISCVT